jgi:universal stress protein A
MADFEQLQQQEQVAKKMRELTAVKFPSLSANAIHFLRGKPAAEIKRMAQDIGADLVVIGSHGHNPIRALLGSIANAVLHGIHCDVLTVRV